MRSVFTLVCLFTALNSGFCFATPKGRRAKPKGESLKISSKKKNLKKSGAAQGVKVESALPSPTVSNEQFKLTPETYSATRNQVNTMLGIHVVKGSALMTGVQFGHRLSQKVPLFGSLEYNVSLYSPGSILGILGGGWYQFPMDSMKSTVLSLGLVAGSGFTTDVIGTPTTVFMGFLDLALAQPMDDLFDLRIQLRPGVMHRYLAFMMNLSIAFRFT